MQEKPRMCLLLKFGTYEVPAEEYRKMLKRALAG